MVGKSGRGTTPAGRGLFAVAVVGFLASACSAGSSSGSGPQPAPVTVPSAALTAPGTSDAEADAALADPGPLPTWDPLSRLAAVDAGVRVLRVFARPWLPEQRWFRELSPLLSPTAAQAHAGTDPARVPAQAVTGAAELLPATSGSIARVAVPTDAGRYTVLLSRKAQAGPWLAERITPPPGAGP